MCRNMGAWNSRGLHRDRFTFTFDNCCLSLKLIPRTCSQSIYMSTSNGSKYLPNIAYRQAFDVLGIGFGPFLYNFSIRPYDHANETLATETGHSTSLTTNADTGHYPEAISLPFTSHPHIQTSQETFSYYEGRTESHEQLFFVRELGTADEGECSGRWNQLLCYP